MINEITLFKGYICMSLQKCWKGSDKNWEFNPIMYGKEWMKVAVFSLTFIGSKSWNQVKVS